MKHTRKLFTVEDWCRWANRPVVRYQIGEIVQTNEDYSGGDDTEGPLTLEVIGYWFDKEGGNIIESLQSQGFFYHEEYYMKNVATGETFLVLPREIKPLLKAVSND